MIQERVLLRVKRFKQHLNECAIAAASSLANYHDPDVEYKNVRKIISARFRKGGMYTSQEGRLLNKLGFTSVRVVTADQSMIDFSWRDFPKEALVEKLKAKRAYYGRSKDPNLKSYVGNMIRWLETDFDNELIIDWNFPKYIRKQLDHGRPLGATVNSTTLFRSKKVSKKGRGDISGDVEDHAIILRGYDTKGVFVVDADDHQCTTGYYKLPWETLLINIPAGDLIWVE